MCVAAPLRQMFPSKQLSANHRQANKSWPITVKLCGGEVVPPAVLNHGSALMLLLFFLSKGIVADMNVDSLSDII